MLRPPSAPADRAGRAPQQLSSPQAPEVQQAQSPRPPDPSAALQQTHEEQAAYLREREATERRSVLRGLMLLVVVILVVSILRAGFGRVFFTGWWRQW